MITQWRGSEILINTAIDCGARTTESLLNRFNGFFGATANG
jgi:hypothetical protein